MTLQNVQDYFNNISQPMLHKNWLPYDRLDDRVVSDHVDRLKIKDSKREAWAVVLNKITQSWRDIRKQRWRRSNMVNISACCMLLCWFVIELIVTVHGTVCPDLSGSLSAASSSLSLRLCIFCYS